MNINLDLYVSSRFLDLEIKKPKGELKRNYGSVKPLIEKSFFVTVGDFVSCTAVEEGSFPDIMVIDGKVEREKFIFKPPKTYRLIRTVNPKGFISARAWRSIQEAFHVAKGGEKVCVVVDGEEDLLGFPVVLSADFGDKMLYGQPGEGVVVVEVTFKMKEMALIYLSFFGVKL